MKRMCLPNKTEAYVLFSIQCGIVFFFFSNTSKVAKLHVGVKLLQRFAGWGTDTEFKFTHTDIIDHQSKA